MQVRRVTRDLVDVEMQQRAEPPLDAGLLAHLAERRVADRCVVGVEVTARLDPDSELAVVHERRPCARLVEDECARREVRDCLIARERLREAVQEVEHRAAVGALLRVARLVRKQQRAEIVAGHVASGWRSSSRPICASSGKKRVQPNAMPSVIAPPKTTDVTVPSSRASTPDSNAPSSFDALMNTISTAVTRPRSAMGVTSSAGLERMLMVKTATNPTTSRQAIGI